MRPEAGQRRFDEMAGMIPLAALGFAPVLVVAAAVVWRLSARGR